MNGTTASIASCSWYQAAGDVAALVAYDVVMPIHVVAGLFGNSLCIFAFYKKAKSDAGFAYQIMLTMNQTLELFVYAMYVSTVYWFSGAEGRPGAVWFRSCYSCMWFASHISFPLINMFITNSLLLTLATAIDRVQALGNPFVYKNINHKRHQAVAFVICSVISICSSLFDCFRFSPEIGADGLYQLAVQTDYIESVLAMVLAHLRNAIRLAAILILVSCNIVMVVLYRRQMHKVAAMTSRGAADQKKKLSQMRILLVLAASESAFNFFSMTALSTYYAMIYAVPDFYECQSKYYGSIVDALIEVFDICDFYVVFAVSKQFQKIILETAPFLKRILCIRTSSSTV